VTRSLKPILLSLTAAGLLHAASPTPALAQDTHLLLITGVSGDEALASQYQKWAAAVIDGAKKRGVAAANIVYLSENPDLDKTRAKGRATREGVTKAFAEVAARAKANDEVFVLLIGHGSFDGRVGAFNLMGPDLTVPEFGKLLESLFQQRVSFVNTASSSGAFLSLAGPGRVIVTATKTGGERNDTRFPEHFVEALGAEEADRDRNGRVSVLEAFEFAKSKVASIYEKGGHILTEHAVLDDGMQGKLAESLYLAPERTRDAATVAAAQSDPAFKALLAEQDALERQIGELRLKKGAMDAAEYEKQFEKLSIALASKTREIRDRLKK
jgi:hypothetical protein